MNPPDEKFRERLLIFMAQKNISQNDLSKQTGVARQQINNIAIGKSGPSFASFLRIRAALGVSADALLGLDSLSLPPILPKWLVDALPELISLDAGQKKALLTVLKGFAAIRKAQDDADNGFDAPRSPKHIEISKRGPGSTEPVPEGPRPD
ncbi:MAG: helix-turn-helix domain-containing protein [Deltaproteobacteria bacterium]|nr:helix-turn-helix domain-containing protein [Deltaproteobacteria bacterium]